MTRILSLAPHAMALFMSAIFLDSLRFKFTNHPNTQGIFGKLDAWAATFGAPGLFGPTGLFSQYVVGAAEGVAAALLIAGITPALRHLQGVGALIGLGVMTSAVGFHLFTPLGIDPNNDGGGLFVVACINLALAAALVFGFRRADVIGFVSRLVGAFAPPR